VSSSTETDVDVMIVGAGVAGLSAGIFTARAGLETELINTGTSILNRNAHLENYPGFPRGINPRLLLEMMRDQAEHSGCKITERAATAISREDTILIDLQGTERSARRLILASWSDVSYAENIGLRTYRNGSKTFVETDEDGLTSVPGIFATGRVAGVRHQSIVAAGDGANVGLSVIEDINPDFYHDWVAPAGYFTDRGRELPEGCEEIDNREREQRARKARQSLKNYLENPPQSGPVPHPSLRNDSD